jgi:hypothetical protein
MEQELAVKLQEDGKHYQTQVEIPVTTTDFYFPLESRPLLVFIDDRVHLRTTQMAKDEELRSLLRKRGYRILELCYDNYSDWKKGPAIRRDPNPPRQRVAPTRLGRHGTIATTGERGCLSLSATSAFGPNNNVASLQD